MDFTLGVLIGIGAASLGLAYYLYGMKESEKVKIIKVLETPQLLRIPHPTPQTGIATDAQKAEIVKHPLSGICKSCRKKSTFPFKCRHCNKVFCSEHRLPESHGCL